MIDQSKIRNFCIIAHIDHGKSTLADRIIEMTGTLTEREMQSQVLDNMELERERGITIKSQAVRIVYKAKDGEEYIFNLIDTPGLFDFAGETVQGVRAAESLLICVSGKSGVDVGTEKAYKMAKDASKATMFFVSKLDADHADFYKVFEELKATFGPTVCPIVVPYVEDREVKSYINLIDMKAYTYDEKGEPHEVEMPDFGHRLDGLTAAVSEAVAETDEALFEKYFSGEQFTRDEIIRGVHTGVTNGSISPVLCGCTTNLQAIDMLLDGIVDLLPSPWEKGGEVAVDADGEPVEVVCTDEAPLAAYVFKTIADPFIGKLSYIKVISGKLSADMTPINSRTGQPERLGKIIYVRGKKQEDTAYITAGDIGAVTKLAATETGDALCDPKKVLNFDPINFPKPCLQMAIKTEAKGDESKIASGLQRLMEEDPTIAYENNAETHQQLVSGLGEQHLDVLVSKLKNKFGVSVSLEVPRVAYRETIRKKVKVQGKHKKQSGGHGQFGDVWIEFEPTVGDGLVFEEKVFGGAVPKSFFPAVEKGLQDCVKHGVLAGYPVVGLKATLVDGSYHPVDSSEMSFKMAASIAYKNGMPEASPVLLEPIGNLKVYVPDSNTGDIIGDLNKRRGRVLGMNPSADGLQEIEADVPMSEMSDFATAIRSMTQGRGYFTFDFARYEQLPSNLEAKVIEEAKKFAGEE